MEEWRTISGFPKYEISNKGRVRNSKTGRIIKTSIDKRGYEYVSLCGSRIKHTRRIHRLVAEAFSDDIDDSLDVIHQDGNRRNNGINNLVTKSRSKKMQDVYRNGKRQIHRMKKIMCIETGEIFDSITECAMAMNTSRQAISRCVNNQALANRDGYHFKEI